MTAHASRSRNRLSLLCIAVSTLAAMVLAAPASDVLAAPTQVQLVITEVTVGAPTPELLRIVGRNLDNGPNLDVTLGEFPGSLVVVSATGSEILAGLPDPLPAGDYLVTVTTGNGTSQRDVYDLTVGAVGPVGPPGPPGAVPDGSIILWDQSSVCPDGFSRVTSYDGRFLVAQGTPGITGGSNTHSHGAGTLTVPDHRHRMEPWDGSPNPIDDNGGGTDYNNRTGPAEGGTMSGTTEPADSRPEFVTLLLCRKDPSA